MNNKSHILSSMTWLKIGLLLIILAFTFINALSLLVSAWIDSKTYSHGFFVPFISLYFVWDDRKRLRELSMQPKKATGILLILTSCFMLIIGNISSIAILQEISILIIIPGLVLMLLGTRQLKALTLPLAYLIFMVPVFDVIISKIQWPFQLLSASMTVKFLQLLGIPVVLDAQYIVLSNITLEVAKECSGIQYLISIIAIAIPLAYFTLREWWLRGILFGFAVIIAIITNWLRIILISFWSIGGGEVHGPNHILQGLFVSVVGFFFLIIAALVLSKIFPQNQSPKLNNCTITKGIIVKDLSLDMKQFNLALFMAIAILFSIGCFIHLYRPKPVPLKIPISELPVTIADWKGEDTYNTKPFVVQGADSEIIRFYRNPSGGEVKLYVGYFESQNQDKELIHYSSQMLYDKSEEIEVPISTNSSIKANKTVLRVGSEVFLLLFVYDIDGKIVANRYRAKFMTAINGLLYRRTNGAIAVVYSNLEHSDEFNKIFDDEVQFIQAVLPVLRNYLSTS
jgi:EpsI family protein